MVVEMRGVEKRYGDVQALAGVDLAVAPGEARLFGGVPDRREARGRVGVMLQESGVPTTLKVRELVALFGR